MAAAAFEASGCGAMTAAGSAAVTLVAQEPLLDAARVGAHAIAAELGGLSPGKFHAADLAADALHRALGAAAARGAALAPAERRTLVAMSGGVDSAVAALLVDRAGRDAVAVTLELWADEANDAEASCCSAHAVRVARAVAHGMGMPHLTLDLRGAFRAGVVEPFLADHAAALTPNPCVRCNGHVRLDAMLELADRLGAADLATGHYARRDGDGLLRTAADPAKDQTYMLSAVAPATLARLRFPLGELTKPRGARARRRGGAAGGLQGRVAGPLLPGRHRQGGVPGPPRRPRRPPRRRRRRRGPRARPPPRPSPLHRRPAARARRGAPPSRSTSSAPTRIRTASWPARAPRWPRGRSPCAARGCTAAGAEVDRVKLRYRSRGAVLPRRGRARRGPPPAAGARARRAGRRRRARPDRLPAARRRGRGVGDDRALEWSVP